MTIKTGIAGAAGRMGKALIRCMQAEHLMHLSLCGAFDRADNPQLGQDAGNVCGVGELGIVLTDSIEKACVNADVIIDFTVPACTLENVRWAAENGKAMVIGTTGLSDEEKKVIAECARKTAIVMAPNMSLGVNLLFSLVNKAAQALADKGYDAEIIERHHRRKKDAPSGTALGLGEELAAGYGWDLKRTAIDGRTGIATEERPVEQIGFHAVRGGDIVGDHTVLFATEGECIELSHRATSRDTFAMGALQAAAWVAGKAPRLYSMKDVLGI
jgi:4-hydroxy-tetrahydrodipicolinate reductase